MFFKDFGAHHVKKNMFYGVAGMAKVMQIIDKNYISYFFSKIASKDSSDPLLAPFWAPFWDHVGVLWSSLW